MEKRFIVMDEVTGANTFTYFKTLHEANTTAARRWDMSFQPDFEDSEEYGVTVLMIEKRAPYFSDTKLENEDFDWTDWEVALEPDDTYFTNGFWKTAKKSRALRL